MPLSFRQRSDAGLAESPTQLPSTRRSWSIRELREACQRDKWQRSRGLTRFNRYLSIYLTAVALRFGVRANTITLFSIAFGCCGALLLMSPWPSVFLLAIAFLYLSFLLDQVDGEVARFNRSASLTGSYLDELRHVLIYAVPVFCLGAGLTVETRHQIAMFAGFLCALSLIVRRFNMNVKYTLFTKKVLCQVNGPVVTPWNAGRAETRVSNASLDRLPTTGKGLLRRVIGATSYILTNQVSMLILLLCFVVTLPFISSETQVGVFLVYTGLVALLTAWDVFAIVRFSKMERTCSQIADQLDTTRSSS